MSVLKSAVIGTGTISKEHLSFLSKTQYARLVGVCDLSRIAAKYAADRFQVDSHYTDYREMLSDLKPDVVHILTPPQTHVKIAVDCLESKAHVICEKPITSTYDEFKYLWSVAQANNRYLIEDHNYRFNQPILKIERLIAEGLLGEVREVEVRMALDIRNGGPFADENHPHPIHNLPAGVLHDLITHLCYLTLRFLPNYDRAVAAWNNYGGDDLFKYDDLDALIIGGSVHARIRFSCYTQPDCFSITVRGTKGYAETDLFQPYLRCVRPRGGKQLSPLINQFVGGRELIGSSIRNFRHKIMQRTPYEGLHHLLNFTYEALANGKQPPISFDDMAETSRLVDTLLMESNRI
jgi:predicted dehydrogenase